jgi:D-sedoheptulose 7-phosphate isomerase
MHIKEQPDRNEYPQASNIISFVQRYADEVHKALYTVSSDLEEARHLMGSRRVFVGGNGGSSAIADHLACDFEKGARRPTVNLSSRPALLSAIANDYGYEFTLSWQLAAAKVDAFDLVILISSSGNSPNILEAASYAKSQGAKILGLTGFDGGYLKKVSDVSLHVNVNNYGIVEDVHQAIMHILAQWHHIKHGPI